MMLTGKIALITGASRGIGRAIAVEFARCGADVALVGRDVAALEETGAACANARAGAAAELFEADVTDRPSMERVVDETLARFGRLDCAIANAGQSVDALLLRLKPETIDRMLDVNLKSAFHLCGAVAKPMMKQRAGSIVLMTSIVGITGRPLEPDRRKVLLADWLDPTCHPCNGKSGGSWRAQAPDAAAALRRRG